MTRHLHDLTVIAHDTEGDTFRHQLETAVTTDPDASCSECNGTAAVPDAREAGVWLVESCRGIPLCNRDGCRLRHLLNHARALEDHETRVAGKKGRRAA
jgi:hypothetical protein